MKKIIVVLLASIPIICLAQKKVKIKKEPVAWSYEISPENPLNENLKTYKVVVDTKLDPMDYWDEINWSLKVKEQDVLKRRKLYDEAVRDTINKWANKYLDLNERPYVRSSPSDFTIKLSTNQFSVEMIQTNIDYDDPESVLGQVNVAARLVVLTSEGNILLDKEIRFYIDDPDGPTTHFKLKHLVVNPTFKLKLRMTKKPEKRKKLLEKRIKRFEADILEFFMEEASAILKDQYLPQYIDSYAGIFSVKNKGHEALNEANITARMAINSLSALSKKKRKTMEQVKPDLEYARDYYTDKLTRTTDPTIQNALNANLATVLLILGDVESAKFQIKNIPEFEELDKKTIWEGSFTYYLRGLADAISIKEKYGERAQLYQF
ncbi:hypothetical protein [Flagellimonas sp.]|uniref:hypothetical protein n=1 Tax=Flagellimonas sp. TaxID=2058762 RepID=UPI003B5BEBF6